MKPLKPLKPLKPWSIIGASNHEYHGASSRCFIPCSQLVAVCRAMTWSGPVDAPEAMALAQQLRCSPKDWRYWHCQFENKWITYDLKYFNSNHVWRIRIFSETCRKSDLNIQQICHLQPYWIVVDRSGLVKLVTRFHYVGRPRRSLCAMLIVSRLQSRSSEFRRKDARKWPQGC